MTDWCGEQPERVNEIPAFAGMTGSQGMTSSQGMTDWCGEQPERVNEIPAFAGMTGSQGMTSLQE